MSNPIDLRAIGCIYKINDNDNNCNDDDDDNNNNNNNDDKL